MKRLLVLLSLPLAASQFNPEFDARQQARLEKWQHTLNALAARRFCSNFIKNPGDFISIPHLYGTDDHCHSPSPLPHEKTQAILPISSPTPESEIPISPEPSCHLKFDSQNSARKNVFCRLEKAPDARLIINAVKLKRLQSS